MNKNIDYLKTHYENYNYPEPVQDIEKELIEKNIVYYDDPTYNWHKIFPEKPFSKDKISILIAGCGTEQAAIIAKLSPQHEVIGIDLSSNSLKHEQKLIDKHKINNLKLICGDFREIKFDRKFDLIISTGVIHHLDDPGSALKYFYNNIKDDGAISLMVYGDKSTHATNQLRKFFFKLNFKQNKESIENVKKIYDKISPTHPGVIHSKNSSELQYDSGIVDHILHESEHFYSIKELNELLKKNNLVIKNFIDSKIKSLTKFFYDDDLLLKKIRKLNYIEQLELGQILNWDDKKIALICCKDTYNQNSLIINPPDLDDVYICTRTGCDYKMNNAIIKINLDTEEEFSFEVPIKKEFVTTWQEIFLGKKKLKYLFNLYNNDEKKQVKKVLTILVENIFVDVSLHPITSPRTLR
jgi:SAM-dependent methyltransferase